MSEYFFLLFNYFETVRSNSSANRNISILEQISPKNLFFHKTSSHMEMMPQLYIHIFPGFFPYRNLSYKLLLDLLTSKTMKTRHVAGISGRPN